MFCHHCGAALADQDRFCAFCGTQKRESVAGPSIDARLTEHRPGQSLGGVLSYVTDNLVVSKNVLFQTRQHWIRLVGPAIFAACMLSFSLIAAFQDAPAFGAIALLTFLLAVIVVGVSFLRWKATEYAVTSKRLIVKSGIITHNREEIMVDKVESIGVDQGCWGRQLDDGTLVLRGTGSTFEPFFHVPSPMEFRKCILVQAASRS
jgi:membrane protein YdbS with pleckstrin-like domain